MKFNWLRTFEEFDSSEWVSRNGEKINYTGRSERITIDQAVSLYKENCRSWDLNEKPIYRGLYIDSDYFYIDPKGKYRQSANSLGNTYNSFFDVLPSWKGVPRRSESLIMTNDLSVAQTYGDAYVMIPYDNYEMVVCPRGDIWSSFDLDHINDLYFLSDLDYEMIELFEFTYRGEVEVNSDNIKEICNKVDSIDKDIISEKFGDKNDFVTAWLKIDLKLFDFVSKLLEFDNKFKIVNNQKDLSLSIQRTKWNGQSNEIWSNGEFLGISIEEYKNFKKKLNL